MKNFSYKIFLKVVCFRSSKIVITSSGIIWRTIFTQWTSAVQLHMKCDVRWRSLRGRRRRLPQVGPHGESTQKPYPQRDPESSPKTRGDAAWVLHPLSAWVPHIFSHRGSKQSPVFLPLLLLLSGDIETNPSYPCSTCSRPYNKRGGSIHTTICTALVYHKDTTFHQGGSATDATPYITWHHKSPPHSSGRPLPVLLATPLGTLMLTIQPGSKHNKLICEERS